MRWVPVHAVILVIHGFINMMSARWMARFMTFSGAYQLLAAILVIFLIPFLAPKHQSTEFVFFKFYGTSESPTGAPNSAYLFMIGMLMSQYTITGYDA